LLKGKSYLRFAAFPCALQLYGLKSGCLAVEELKELMAWLKEIVV
jgi:hypothetical protein